MTNAIELKDTITARMFLNLHGKSETENIKKNTAIFVLPEETDLNLFSKIGLKKNKLLFVLLNGEKFSVELSKSEKEKLNSIVPTNWEFYITNKKETKETDLYFNLREISILN